MIIFISKENWKDILLFVAGSINCFVCKWFILFRNFPFWVISLLREGYMWEILNLLFASATALRIHFFPGLTFFTCCISWIFDIVIWCQFFLALIPQVGLIWFFLVWMFLVMWVLLSDVLGEVSTPWSPLGCP